VNWLEIPAHRVLEVESKELEEEFDIMMTTGSFAVVAAYISCPRRKTERTSSSLEPEECDSVTL